METKSCVPATEPQTEPLLLSEKQVEELSKTHKRDVGVHRHDSMENYLRYLCSLFLDKTRERSFMRTQRNRPNFFKHLLELYKEQEGRCFVTGAPLKRPTAEGNNPATDWRTISILRFNRDIGYVPGNCKLSCRIVTQIFTMDGIDGVYELFYYISHYSHRLFEAMEEDRIKNDPVRIQKRLTHDEPLVVIPET